MRAVVEGLCSLEDAVSAAWDPSHGLLVADPLWQSLSERLGNKSQVCLLLAVSPLLQTLIAHRLAWERHQGLTTLSRACQIYQGSCLCFCGTCLRVRHGLHCMRPRPGTSDLQAFHLYNCSRAPLQQHIVLKKHIAMRAATQEIGGSSASCEGQTAVLCNRSHPGSLAKA